MVGLRNEYAQPRRDFATEVPYGSGELVRIFPHDPEATADGFSSTFNSCLLRATWWFGADLLIVSS